MFLEIHELKKGYGSGENRTEVLQGIDFTVNKGEICVLLGPSGSGKSTLLNIIGGIDTADSGYVKDTDTLSQKTSGLCISDVQSDPESECEGEYRGRRLFK